MKMKSSPRFIWDNDKARANERKHGVAFQLAATVLSDELARVSHDDSHEGAEDRWIYVGEAVGSALLVVVVAVKNGDHEVRVISARKATLREKREYESGEYTVREVPIMTEYDINPNDDDDPDMKAEYDFSNAKRGGPLANARLPVCVDNALLRYFHAKGNATGTTMDELIDEVLRQHVVATGYVFPVYPDPPR